MVELLVASHVDVEGGDGDVAFPEAADVGVFVVVREAVLIAEPVGFAAGLVNVTVVDVLEFGG